MIKKFLPHVLELLKSEGLGLTFVDIGSRNSVIELHDIASFVLAYGFEPNPIEYDKLLSEQTDRFLATGARPPQYRKLAYNPYAVGNRCGRHEFYVTPGPGACGMLEPNIERLREIVWKGESINQRTFAEEHFADFRKIEVEVTTLDAFTARQGIDHIDYLKIDVEGSEYEVFEGAAGILPFTAVIKVEVCFIPFRKGQKLFSEVDQLLRRYDFDLLRYETHLGHVGYKERRHPLCYIPLRYPDPFGQPLSCDAIYVNRGIRDPRRALSQAIVLLELNYVDEALHVFKKVGLNDERFCEMLRTYHGGASFGMKLRGLGYQAVDLIVGMTGWLLKTFRK